MFDSKTTRALAKQINDALKTTMTKSGMILEIPKWKWNPEKASFTLEVSKPMDKTTKAKIHDKNKEIWNAHCRDYGLNKLYFGKIIHIKRSTYKIVGLNPNKPKFCVQLERADGAMFSCAPSYVKLGLGQYEKN